MQRLVYRVACNQDTLLRVRQLCVEFLFQMVWRSTNELRRAAAGLVFQHQWHIFKSCNYETPSSLFARMVTDQWTGADVQAPSILG